MSWSQTYGLPLHEISPAEVAGQFPPVDLDGRSVGAAYLESDGYLDPSQLCYALAGLGPRRRRAGSTSSPG